MGFQENQTNTPKTPKSPELLKAADVALKLDPEFQAQAQLDVDARVQLNLGKLAELAEEKREKPTALETAVDNLAAWLSENGLEGGKETWSGGHERNTYINWFNKPSNISLYGGVSQTSDPFEQNPAAFKSYVGMELPKIAGFTPFVEMNPVDFSDWFFAVYRELPGGGRLRVGIVASLPQKETASPEEETTKDQVQEISVNWNQPIQQGNAGHLAFGASIIPGTAEENPQGFVGGRYRIDF